MNNSEKAYENALALYNAGSYKSCLDEFLALSAKGHAKSSFYAGSVYLKGADGIERNEVRARKLYGLALDQEFLPGAALSVALMEYQGKGGDQRLQKFNASLLNGEGESVCESHDRNDDPTWIRMRK